MQTFASVSAGLVAAVVDIPDGLTPGKDVFTPAYAATLVSVPSAKVGLVASGWTYSGGAFSPPVVAAPSKADLKAHAANARWMAETGGITVSGAQIDTSRDSQAMIANAYAFVQASGATSIPYKAASGWVTMDAATVKAIAVAVGAHVQACFAAEQTLDAEIDAGTVTTFAQIDATTWPA